MTSLISATVMTCLKQWVEPAVTSDGETAGFHDILHYITLGLSTILHNELRLWTCIM